MALTKPFFNTIPAFDATLGTSIQFCVLGGDAITEYTYKIFENISGAQVPVDTLLNLTMTRAVSDDVPSSAIRTFSIPIEANALQNNYSYKIVVSTSDGTESSVDSEYQIFSCCIRPTLSLYRYINNSFVALSNNTSIGPAIGVKVFPVISYNDSSSTASISRGKVSAYGVKPNGEIVLLDEKELNFEDITTLSDLDFNSNYVILEGLENNYQEFSTYNIVYNGITTDNMSLSVTYTGLTDSVSITNSAATNILKLTNNCDTGFIALEIDLEPESASAYGFSLQLREVGEDKWATFCGSTSGFDAQSFNPEAQLSIPYCRNNTTYKFRLVLYSSEGTVDKVYINEVESSFSKSYICDTTEIYDITKEWSVDSYSVANENAVFEPFNSKYPTVVKDLSKLFRQGQYTAVLLSTISQNIDRSAQVVLKSKFEHWLSDGNAKIIKTLNGDLFLVYITNAIASGYYRQLANGIASSSFSWMECGHLYSSIMQQRLNLVLPEYVDVRKFNYTGIDINGVYENEEGYSGTPVEYALGSVVVTYTFYDEVIPTPITKSGYSGYYVSQGGSWQSCSYNSSNDSLTPLGIEVGVTPCYRRINTTQWQTNPNYIYGSRDYSFLINNGFNSEYFDNYDFTTRYDTAEELPTLSGLINLTLPATYNDVPVARIFKHAFMGKEYIDVLTGFKYLAPYKTESLKLGENIKTIDSIGIAAMCHRNDSPSNIFVLNNSLETINDSSLIGIFSSTDVISFPNTLSYLAADSTSSNPFTSLAAPYGGNPYKVIISSPSIRLNCYSPSYIVFENTVSVIIGGFANSLSSSSNIPSLVFKHSQNAQVSLSINSEKNARTINIYTDCDAVRNYNWAGANYTPTFYPLSDYEGD